MGRGEIPLCDGCVTAVWSTIGCERHDVVSRCGVRSCRTDIYQLPRVEDLQRLDRAASRQSVVVQEYHELCMRGLQE